MSDARPHLKFEDSNWWLASDLGRQPHEYLMGLVSAMRNTQAIRYDNFRRLQNIYEWGYKAAYSLQDGGYGTGDARYTQTQDAPIDEEILAYNAAANVIDTVHAKVTKLKIVPMPLTSGGNYLQQQNAKRLGQALEGEFYENDVDAVKEDVIKEALINGTGWAKVFQEWGRIKVEMVPCEDVVVDDSEGRYRSPRSMYHRQLIDRYVLREIYGVDDDTLSGTKEERIRAIMSAPCAYPVGGGYAQSHDQVEVVEAYHLPSRPIEYDDEGEISDHDGRHAICIDGCTLMDAPWDRNVFPFAKYAPIPRRRSVWGLALMHKLASGQREYEKLTQRIQLAFERMGGSHILTSRDANIESRELSNGIGTHISVDGPTTGIQVFNPDSVSAQTLGYVAGIPDNMMQSNGISPLSAQQQLPAGLQQASGKALQVFEDFESERLVAYHRAVERWILAVSDLIVLEARAIVKENKDYSVRYRGKKAIEAIKWSDVLLDEDDFVMSIFPISMLSKTPAAKFQQLQELLNSGAITIEQFKRLFEMPDLEAENELDTADENVIDKMLAIIAYKNKVIEPQPFDDLQMAIGRTRKFINMLRAQDGIPDATFERLHDFMLSLQDLQKEALPPPAPPMPSPNGAPPAPMSPPGGMPASPAAPPMPQAT